MEERERTVLAFKMRVLSRRIEEFNLSDNPDVDNQSKKLQEERLTLLSTYYKREFGENIVSL